MCHVFLPSDPRLKRLAVADRGGAQPRAGASSPRARRSPSAASARETGEAFRALWSSARRDDDVLQTTQPGDALQLFAEPAPPAPRRRWPRSRRRRRPRPAGAGDGVRAARAPARRAARAGGDDRAPHRRGAPQVNARINREVGARVGRTSRPTSSSSRRTGCWRREVDAPLVADGRAPGVARRDGRGALDGRGRAARDPGLDRGPRAGPRTIVLRAGAAARVARAAARGPALRADDARRRATSRSPRSGARGLAEGERVAVVRVESSGSRTTGRDTFVIDDGVQLALDRRGRRARATPTCAGCAVSPRGGLRLRRDAAERGARLGRRGRTGSA